MWYLPVVPPRIEMTFIDGIGVCGAHTVCPETRGRFVEGVYLQPFERVTVNGNPATVLGQDGADSDLWWIAYDRQRSVRTVDPSRPFCTIEARSTKTDRDEGTYVNSPVFDYFSPQVYVPLPDFFRTQIFDHHRRYMDEAHRGVRTDDSVQLGRLSPNMKFYCKTFLLCAPIPPDVFRMCLLPLLLPDWIWLCERRSFLYQLNYERPPLIETAVRTYCNVV